MRSYQLPLGILIMIGGLVAGNHLSSMILREPVGFRRIATRVQDTAVEATRFCRIATLAASATFEIIANPERSVE